MLRPPVRLIIVPWLIPRWAQAQVWGRVILIRRGIKVTEQLLAHELAHVLQWRSLGILPFIFNYLAHFSEARYLNHPGTASLRAAEFNDSTAPGPADTGTNFMIPNLQHRFFMYHCLDGCRSLPQNPELH
jgi:hypothetical protein